MTTTELALTLFAAIFAVIGVLRYLVWPCFKMEYRRRASRSIKVEPQQIWVQDSGILYIESIDATGVWLITMHEGKAKRWQDTWESWNLRLKNRNVWYTGRRQPLV